MSSRRFRPGDLLIRTNDVAAALRPEPQNPSTVTQNEIVNRIEQGEAVFVLEVERSFKYDEFVCFDIKVLVFSGSPRVGYVWSTTAQSWMFLNK